MEINEVCSRCGKSIPLEADMEQMVAKIEEEKAVQENIRRIKEFASTLEGPLPEVVTFSWQNDTYTVEALPRLCGPNENNKRNKSGCLGRARTLLDEIHLRSKKGD